MPGSSPATLALADLDCTADEIRRAAAQYSIPTADEVRRARVNCLYPRGCKNGRRGLPKEAVDIMYADYQRGLSTYKLAKLYQRSAQAVWEILHNHGCKLREKNRALVVEWHGRRFTLGKSGSLRETSGKRRLLKHLVWQSMHGRIRSAHQVICMDGNESNCALQNLQCLPIDQVTLFYHRVHQAGLCKATLNRER